MLQLSNERAFRLQLIKNNFKDFYSEANITSDNKDECKIIFIINTRKESLLLTTSYRLYMPNPDEVIQSLDSNDIDYIQFINRKSTQILYDTDGVILIETSSEKVDKKINKIRFGNK